MNGTPNPKRWLIDGKDFRALVAGKPVSIPIDNGDTIEIVLMANVSAGVMQNAIREVEIKAERKEDVDADA